MITILKYKMLIKLAKLYNLTLDELIEFDIDAKEIEEVIKNTNEKKKKKSTGHRLGERNIPF